MPSSDKKQINYVVDENTVFPSGFDRADIVRERHFGKRVDVLHIKASEEVCIEYKRMEEREHKAEQRNNICMHMKNGRCISNECYGCSHYHPSGDGSGTLSIDQFMEENGDVMEDTSHYADPEKEMIKQEFWETLDRFKDSQSDEEKILVEGIINNTPDKELMRRLGISRQSTCNSKKQVMKQKLQVVFQYLRD